MKPSVLVTRRLPQPALDMLEEYCTVTLNPHDRALTRSELMNEVKGKQGLLCLLTDTVDAELMDAGSELEIIANYAVGFDNIDLDAATRRKIPVTNTPGVLTDTTADLAWALILAAARRIAEADKFTREGKFKEWGPMLILGRDVHGATLGIIGLGRIGSAVARRAMGFDMQVLYADATRAEEKLERELKVTFVTKEELLRQADFVTVHVPLSDQTKHFIGKDELRMMKKTAFLINTSRGPVIDERALVDALKREEIAGAGLDVYESEPELAPGLADLENVVLLPHIGSASVETRTKMALIAAENLLAVLQGKRPPNIVNPRVLE